MAQALPKIAGLFSGQDDIVGLDIGTSAIKLVQFTRKQGARQLTRLILKDLDLQKDTLVAQLDALKELNKEINFQGKQVRAVINCPRSCSRIVTLPFMPKTEIAQALRWEMKDSISFPPEEAALDYAVLQQVSDGGAKKLKVAVACSPQSTVNEYLNLFTQAGIAPAMFAQAGFTLQTLISAFGGEKYKPVAILDIGYSFSELLIFQGEQLVFSRKLPLAGENFTKDITQVLVSEHGRLQLSFAEAEAIKKKYGIPESASPELLEGKITGGQLLSLLRPNVEKFAEELERSFDFYREKEHGSKPERLVLLGGGSALKGLTKYLSQHLEIPVELGNPFVTLTASTPYLLENNAPQAHRFAQGIGVALCDKDAVNILPKEIKEQTKLFITRSSIKALVAAGIAILVLTYIGMQIKLTTDNQRLAAAELELKALSPRLGQMERQSYLMGVLNQRVYWSDVFKELGNCTPPQIRLTSLIAQKKTISLHGEIKAEGASEEKALTECMNALSKGIFKDVKLVTTKKGATPQEPYIFELRLEVK
ncbi:MAG: type IV pilus assembly protein PilM [Candidatus Omnitrophota bacterium]